MSSARERWFKQQLEYTYGKNKSSRKSKKAIVGRIPVQGPLLPNTQFVQRKSGQTYTRRIPKKKIETAMYAEPIGPTIPENMRLIKTKKGKVYYRRVRGKGKGKGKPIPNTIETIPNTLVTNLPSNAVKYIKRNKTIGYKVKKLSKKSGKSYWKYL